MLFFFCFTYSNYVKADVVDLYSVGRTINVAKAKSYNDIVLGSRILDNNYYFNEMNVVRSNFNKSSSYISYSTSISDMRTKFNSQYSTELSIAGKIVNEFTFAASNKYSINYDYQCKEYYSSFYEDISSISYQNIEAIDGYFFYSTRNELKDNLDENYKNDLIKVSNGEMSYYDLFDFYGTHLLLLLN